VQPDFWLERWRTNQIAFHQPSVSRHLQHWWPELALGEAAKVFVPLCGKSLDLKWLAARGHPVLGVELSDTAIEAFCAENGIPARRRAEGAFDRYQADGLELLRGDFFDLVPAHLDGVRGVYDRASLVAMPPALREAYARHMTALTAAGTVTLLVAFEYRQDQMKGPPFNVAEADVQRLYGADHRIELLGREDILATEPRFVSKGVTALHEACYRITRH
jgi:thiopurine S-methyltransferase